MTFTDNNTLTQGGIAISYQDSAKFKKREFSLSSKGICLKSRLPFEIGLEVAISVELPREQITFKGIVVDCRKSLHRDRTFDITIFFHEQTAELQKKLKLASPYFSPSPKREATPQLVLA